MAEVNVGRTEEKSAGMEVRKGGKYADGMGHWGGSKDRDGRPRGGKGGGGEGMLMGRKGGRGGGREGRIAHEGVVGKVGKGSSTGGQME